MLKANACTPVPCKEITLRSSSFPQWCMKAEGSRKKKTWYNSASTDVHIHQQVFVFFAIHFFTVVPQEDTKKVLYFRSQSSVTWLSRKRNGCFSSAAKKNVFANIKWYAFTSWKEQLKLLSETFCSYCSFGKLLLRIIRVGFIFKNLLKLFWSNSDNFWNYRHPKNQPE